MNEKLNYISDEELERLIVQVEQEELVTAPPDLMEEILAKLEDATIRPVKTAAVKKKEFYAYCFRVITSVAAAIVLVFLLPEVSKWEKNTVTIPTKEEVVLAGSIPTKEEVLDDTGVFEKALRNIEWFGKEE